MIAAVVMLFAGLAVAGAPIDATRHAFVEIETERSSYFANEPFVVRLRVGVEQAFLRDHVVQLFAQQLDVPVQVQAPWFGAYAEVAAPAAAARQTFALDDVVVAGTRLDDRVVDGRTFMVLEIERRAIAGEAGALELPAPRLVLAYATRFDDDLLQGRVALDRLDATIEGAPRALSIAPLPERGKPSGFTGAIGRFTVSAVASADAVGVGETFQLKVTITGAGNLAEFAQLRWDALAGFHVLGARDQFEGATRAFVLDLAATRADLGAIPSIAFPYFDPEAGAYATAHSDAIPLAVRGGSVATPTESVAPAAAAEVEASAPLAWIAIALALVALITIAARRRRTRPVPDTAAIESRRRADAALAAFHARVIAEPRALESALVEYLAARLQCAPAAVIAPDLADRLVGAGVDPSDAHAVADVFEALISARYGGDHAGVEPREVTSLMERIDAAVRQVSE